MPEFDSTTKEKIAELRDISRNWTETLEVYELLKLDWSDGAIYYAATQVNELSPDLPPEITPVKCLVVTDEFPNVFLPIATESTLSDEEIDLTIWDGDGSFADLVAENGEGIKAEVIMWFPAVELLLTVWHGHLRTDEESDAYFWKGKIANGFRSSDTQMPRRAHYRECQAIYGGLLDSLDEIAENDCPHNAHLPGGTVGNALFATCDRKAPTSCTARGVNPLYHLSHQSSVLLVRNNQTSGPNLNSVTRGNESNLKEPVRVILGVRRIRECEVLAYRRDYNNNTPDRGWFDAIFEVCEGPVREFRATFVNGRAVESMHYGERRGMRGQSSISSNLSTHGYSGTGIIRYNYGWVNPGTIDPANHTLTTICFGLEDVRIYTDADTFSLDWTDNRAWHIARMFCDRRWGYGSDYSRLHIESFIESAEFTAPTVTFETPEGTSYSFFRAASAVELTERTSQQQIEDMCSAGRLSRPYLFEGKICVSPLRALTEKELDDAPVFTDEGMTGRNIIFEDINGTERSTLTRSQKSDLDLPNRIESTYHDSTKDWTETPSAPAEDVEQQLKAGRVLGDTSRRTVTKKYAWLGCVQEGHAISLNYWTLWFGEFCEGGLKNNLTIKFKAWYFDTLELHEFKVIKVVSSQLERYGFEYFMITSKARSGNLHVEITAQAWNNEEIANFDTIAGSPPPTEPPPPYPSPNPLPLPTPSPGPSPGPTELPPCVLEFGTINFENGLVQIEILPC